MNSHEDFGVIKTSEFNDQLSEDKLFKVQFVCGFRY